MEQFNLLQNNVALEIFSFIFGTIVGSFLNVCISRIPDGKSIVFPPSHCPSCKAKIKPQHNIPIFSYLFLKGKCDSCNSKISIQYPIVELISGVLTFLLFIKFGLTLEFLTYFVLCMSLIVITFIDLKYMIIPNIISLPGIIVGLIFSALRTDWQYLFTSLPEINSFNVIRVVGENPFLNAIIGIILGAGIFLLIANIYKIVRKMDGLGMGDVKLLAMLGAFLGTGGVFFIIFISSLLGTIVGVSIIAYYKGDMKYAIPYGPFLSLAAVIYIFTGGLNFIFSILNNGNF